MDKRGQVKMSFGMIFSIILIIAFIAFAIFGIHKFLSLQSGITTNQFVSNLQSDVTTVWKSTQASRPETYSIPSSIKQVCFTKSKGGNGGSNNMVLWTATDPLGSYKIEHLNMSAITSESNGGCFNTTNGKISFTLEMNFGETLVTLK